MTDTGAGLLHQFPGDTRQQILGELPPRELGRTRALIADADDPSLWLRLRMPTKSRQLMIQMRELTNQTEDQSDEGVELPQCNLVLVSGSRNTGASTLLDALCSRALFNGPEFDPKDPDTPAMRNDVVLDWTYCELRGVYTRVAVKKIRCTARETPFSACIYTKPNTAVLVLLDLTKSFSEQATALNEQLQACRRHGVFSGYVQLVGTKSQHPECKGQALEAAHRFALEQQLPYIEVDAKTDASELWHAAMAVAAGAAELRTPSIFDHACEAHGESCRREVSEPPRFVGGLLEELKARASFGALP